MTIFEFMVNTLYMLFSKKKQLRAPEKRKYETLRRGEIG